MKFNICLIQPQGYKHSQAFAELAELLFYSLIDLGKTTTLRINDLFVDSRNILIGVHLLDKSFIKSIKSKYSSTIILNTEQYSGSNKEWKNNIFEWVSNFETWDYSQENLSHFAKNGIDNARLFRIGYSEKLRRIKKNENQDIDILFYGSINERRLIVLNKLKFLGLNVSLNFGVYGEARDDLISRAKVVLNLHYYNSKIFEIVRVFYLMINSKAVVGEIEPDSKIDPIYLKGFYSSNYDNLTNACLELISDQKKRVKIERDSFETISAFPQKEFTKLLIN